MLERLNNRGELSVRILEELNDGAEETVLFRGYAVSPRNIRRGRAGLTFPDRIERQVECLGEWMRLEEAMGPFHTLYLYDGEAAKAAKDAGQPNTYIPLKITDIIRQAIRFAGYLDAQIDVPDNPMRLWIDPDQPQDVNVPPFTSPLKLATDYARDWLGAYLFWDANAGTMNGMWRLKIGLKAGTPLFTFKTRTPAGFGLVNKPALWGVNSTFVAKPGIVRYVLKPDYNAVMVTANLDFDVTKGTFFGYTVPLINPRSVNTPQFGNTADPDHPDYLGTLKWLPRLEINGTPASVNFLARRLYQINCFGRRRAEFIAPFFPVQDPDDANFLGRWRPLRYGDTVNLQNEKTGALEPHFVLSANPAWERTDAHQVCHYELQAVTA